MMEDYTDQWIKALLGAALLCQFCGTDTRHGKGTGKEATHRTSSGDGVCRECYEEFEDALETGEEGSD